METEDRLPPRTGAGKSTSKVQASNSKLQTSTGPLWNHLLSLLCFVQKLQRGFNEHFAGAGFYAGVGDFITAFSEGFLRRDVAGAIVADGLNDGGFEWG